MSERQACAVRGADRSPVPAAPSGPATRRCGRVCGRPEQRRRFGCRRLHVLLRLEGNALKRRKTRRLYRKDGLAVRRCRSRRRIAVARTPIPGPEGRNSRRSADLVHDRLADGRRFRVPTRIDEVTRGCRAAVADTSLPGKRGVRKPEALTARRGRPGGIVSDSGTGFRSLRC